MATPAVVPAPARTGIRSLITDHDTMHLHKTLGIVAVVHYVYRIAKFGATDMGFDGSWFTFGCLMLHTVLSLSSLIFKLPVIRIKEGTRIWPQFRLHSIVFTCRALAAMTVLWATTRFPAARAAVDSMYGLDNVAIVFLAMLLADWSTAAVGDRKSDSIRGWNTSVGYRFFFAVMQFQGTALILVGVRRFGVYFFHVIILQLTAFLLTIRRKNLVGHRSVAVVYAALLLLGTSVSLYDFVWTGRGDLVGSVGLVAYLLRVPGGMNKYLVWGLMAVVVVLTSVYLAPLQAQGGMLAPEAQWLRSIFQFVQLPSYALLYFWAWPAYKRYCASKEQ